MNPIEQTILRPPDGNCFAACVASILELRLDEVPNYPWEGNGASWVKQWQDWLAKINLGFLFYSPPVEQAATSAPGGYSIGTGKSPRGDWNHAVVMKDGRLVWDPSPRREEGMGAIVEYSALCVLDPTKALAPAHEKINEFECCDTPEQRLVEANRGSAGVENVFVCGACGNFRVFALVDGHHYEKQFRLWSGDAVIAASQSYYRARTGSAFDPTERVWKPLDLAGLRLYRVRLSHQTACYTKTKYFIVAGYSPQHAAVLVKQIYGPEFSKRTDLVYWDAIGEPVKVLQPRDWVENGIRLLNGADRIKCAAVLKDGVVYRCLRHSYTELMRTNPEAPEDVLRHSEQGFVTEDGRFVDREEGLLIAMASNQIHHKHPNIHELFSEDLNCRSEECQYYSAGLVGRPRDVTKTKTPAVGAH